MYEHALLLFLSKSLLSEFFKKKRKRRKRKRRKREKKGEKK